MDDKKYKNFMLNVVKCLLDEDVVAIKYYYSEKIGDGVLEKIKTPIELIQTLERHRILAKDNYNKFVKLLNNIGRQDLANNFSEINAANINVSYEELSSEIIDEVAYQIGSEWRRFGRHLNLKDVDLEHIDVDYKKTHDKALQLLKLWKQKSKEGCLTWSQLKKQLELFERFDIIRELKKKFKQLRDDEQVAIAPNDVIDNLNMVEFISDIDNFKLKPIKVLGSCAFGKVYLCINERTGKKLAMKSIDTGNTDNNANAKKEGSLYDKVSNKGALDEKTASEKSYQILCGLEYLHNKNIVHRDIKCANILLDLYGNCKLADFGISKQIQTIRSQAGCKTSAGTPYWMSPEVISATFLNIEYGKKADIWSFGCTVLEMLTTKPPWSHLDPTPAMFQIVSSPTIPHLPDNSSNSCITFVNDCFQRDPKIRPNALQLLSYDWVKRSA
ncbi:uncharacterized protein LOC101238726 isoform X2 [Hydra vulgaris]|uniref:uncharacterized protein LOC101238726 isoform X2 n=1 Tax=Hydra vulgaris TaxID=6087 RepID=UPI0032E9CE87